MVASGPRLHRGRRTRAAIVAVWVSGPGGCQSVPENAIGDAGTAGNTEGGSAESGTGADESKGASSRTSEASDASSTGDGASSGTSEASETSEASGTPEVSGTSEASGTSGTTGGQETPGDDGSSEEDESGPPPEANLPAGVAERFPRGEASGVCTDAALRLRFERDVRLGTDGSIRIARVDLPGTPVDAIDVAAPGRQETIGGRVFNLVRPIFVEGSDVSVYFRSGVLEPETTYTVTIDPGVFLDPDGQAVGTVTDPEVWQFTTGPAPPVTSPIQVDRDGGTFCTVGGALEAIPAGSTAPITLEVAAGSYYEIIHFERKSNITIHGAGQDQTRIVYPNNEMLNPGTAGRAMFGIRDADGLALEDLMLENTTPQGGGQAETLRAQAERVSARRCHFKSLQDTLLLSGTVYIADSLIEGNVDFIWGSGAAFFERVEVRTVGRSGYGLQARNDAGYGYVFVDSRLTADAGIDGHVLARIDANEYPRSQVVHIDCQMGPHIDPAGYLVTPAGAPTGQLQFWEHGTTDLEGRPLDLSGRHPASRELSAQEAEPLRDPTVVLGGWDPDAP